MPDDDLVLRGFIENQIGKRRNDHPTDDWIVGPATDMGMDWQKIGQRVNSRLNPTSALR
jgi:hypothetical protein